MTSHDLSATSLELYLARYIRVDQDHVDSASLLIAQQAFSAHDVPACAHRHPRRVHFGAGFIFTRGCSCGIAYHVDTS